MDHAPHSAGWPGGPGPWQAVWEKAASCFLRDRALCVGCVLGCPQARNQHLVPRGSFHVLRAWPGPPAARSCRTPPPGCGQPLPSPPPHPRPGDRAGLEVSSGSRAVAPAHHQARLVLALPLFPGRAVDQLPVQNGVSRVEQDVLRPVSRPSPHEDGRWAITLASARGRQGCVTGLTVFSS